MPIDETSEVQVQADINTELEGRYLTFWTDGQIFAIPISNVVQIVQMQEITEIPEFPMYAKGVIDLRGTMIPVVDLRLRLGKMEAEYDVHTCIIVMNIRNALVGLVVDRVDEVAYIGEENISQAPSIGASVSSQFLEGLAKTVKGVVLLLAIEQVIGDGFYEGFSM